MAIESKVAIVGDFGAITNYPLHIKASDLDYAGSITNDLTGFVASPTNDQLSLPVFPTQQALRQGVLQNVYIRVKMPNGTFRNHTVITNPAAADYAALRALANATNPVSYRGGTIESITTTRGRLVSNN
jgi:phosphoribosylcarboxyaminoimidazole (NCAIR) mutase